jgi:hypothetical protein
LEEKYAWEFILNVKPPINLLSEEASKPIDLYSQTLEEIQENLQSRPLESYQTAKVRGYGNCTYRAALIATGNSDANHIELRHKVADIIETSLYEPGTFEEYGVTNAEEYAEKVRRDKYYAGQIELYALASYHKIWIAVYMADTRYNVNRWQIIKHSESEKPSKIISLHLKQGSNPTADREGLTMH